MKMLEFYKSILSLCNMTVSTDGMISVEFGDESIPVNLNEKRLVIPTEKQLQNGDWEYRSLFHPLSEHISKGESDVLAKYRKMLSANFNIAIGTLLEDLITLASSPKLHKRLNPDQSEILVLLKDVDEKTLSNLESMLLNAKKNKDINIFLHIFLKKNGVINNVKYNRACIVSSPFYEAICGEEKTVYGTTLRIKDKLIFKTLIEYVLFNIELPHSFSRGSNDTMAPFFDALMKSVMVITDNINNIVEKYNGIIDCVSNLQYETDWVIPFDNLSTFIGEVRMIPMHSTSQTAEQPTAPVNVLAYTQPQPLQTQHQAPVIFQSQQPVIDQQNYIDANGNVYTNGEYDPMATLTAKARQQGNNSFGGFNNFSQPQNQRVSSFDRNNNTGYNNNNQFMNNGSRYL